MDGRIVSDKQMFHKRICQHLFSHILFTLNTKVTHFLFLEVLGANNVRFKMC